MDFSKLQLTPANHVKAAKLVRRKAANSNDAERAKCLQASNTLLNCAALACRAAGDSLDLSSFDRTAVCPDWSVIDSQIARFRLERECTHLRLCHLHAECLPRRKGRYAALAHMTYGGGVPDWRARST